MPNAETTPALTYQPTEREQRAVDTRKARREAAMPHPRLKITNVQDGATINCRIAIDHEDPIVGWDVLVAGLGFSDPKAASVIVDQVATVAQNTAGVDQDQANGILAIVQEIAPRDATEAMLAVQMATIHAATIKQAAALNLCLTLPSQYDRYESHSNALNKLSRTFATQMEALKRYRSKGEQKVVVEHQHVHVHPGGQAVVGDVYRQGEGEQENEGQPHGREPVRLPQRPPMLREIKANRLPVSGASDDRVDRLPVSRRGRRPAVG